MDETPPQREGPTFEEIARGTAGAVVAALVELIRAVRSEVEAAQRSASAFVARILHAASRAWTLLLQAARDALLAAVFLVVGVIVFSIFLVGMLNVLLGDPWGTGVAALFLFVIAGALWMRARLAMRKIRDEADRLRE